MLKNFLFVLLVGTLHVPLNIPNPTFCSDLLMKWCKIIRKCSKSNNVIVNCDFASTSSITQLQNYTVQSSNNNAVLGALLLYDHFIM